MNHVLHRIDEKNNPCSVHARIRMQQRCIPAIVPDCLLDYGASHRTAHGNIRYFNKRSRRCIQRDLTPARKKQVEPYFNCYLVEADDGTIITVGYRYRRMRHRD